MTNQPVELHVISDSTGETAVRLVHALEAQFPEQEFEEIRHPRVETVDDLHLALNRAKGRPAVIVYTLVEPELREEAERALAEGLAEVSIDGDVHEALESGATLAPLMERFFEEVLVMDEDPAVRANRLRLLLDVRDTLGRLGDFSQIPR